MGKKRNKVIYNSESETASEDLASAAEELSQELSSDIVALGDLVMWNSRALRTHGYRFLGKNLSSVLSAFDGESYKLFYDPNDGELKADVEVKNGTNHYTFRTVKDDEKWAKLWFPFITNRATSADVDAATDSLGPAVCEIYDGS